MSNIAYKNPDLHAAVKAFVIAAMSLVHQRALADCNQHDLNEQIFFFAKLASSDNLQELPEYQSCLQVLLADTTFSGQLKVLVGPRGGPRFQSADANGLMSQLIDLGVSRGQFTFDAEQFEEGYAELEKAYYDSGIEFNAIAPLNGFVATRPIRLPPDIEILELTEEYATPAAKATSPESGAGFWNEKPYAVSIKYSLPKIIGQDHELRPEHRLADDATRKTVNKQIAEVVTALRLCGIESVYVPSILHKTSKWSFGRSVSFPGQFYPEIHFSMPADDAFLQRLGDLWGRLQATGVKKHSFLQSAIRRFGYAYERHRIEDKIVDLLICGEALFLSSDSYTAELKYRLSLRASVFLATDIDARQRIFNRMKAAYDFRSAVVHGASYNANRLPTNKGGQRPSVEEFVFQIQEYMRIAIIRMVQLANQSKASGDLVNWDKLCLGVAETPNIE
jgi:hypothetical protein